MALKVSGAYRQCKPGTSSSSSYKKGQRPYTDYDTVSEGVHYPYMRGGPGSSNSTPGWDFTSNSREVPGDSRFKGMSSNDRNPGGVGSDAQPGDVVLVDEDEPKEWMAQVEPGVHITFVSLPQGGNDLKRIRFRYYFFTFHIQLVMDLTKVGWMTMVHHLICHSPWSCFTFFC